MGIIYINNILSAILCSRKQANLEWLQKTEALQQVIDRSNNIGLSN